MRFEHAHATNRTSCQKLITVFVLSLPPKGSLGYRLGYQATEEARRHHVQDSRRHHVQDCGFSIMQSTLTHGHESFAMSFCNMELIKVLHVMLPCLLSSVYSHLHGPPILHCILASQNNMFYQCVVYILLLGTR